jgi:light-regulated signal transduction histidine kinase (bacteriophytochrome)
VLYDEHLILENDFDPLPLFKKHVELNLYGRHWQFDLWSTKSFRVSVSDSQPTIILVGGIFIDCLLLFLFVLISRANRNALAYADQMNQELQVEKSLLENSNQELEHFAYVASHDLQEPLRMVSSFLQLLQRRYSAQLDEKANRYIAQAVDGSVRMKGLILDLLNYSRVGASQEMQLIDCNAVLQQVLKTLDGHIEEANVLVTYDKLPTAMADEGQLGQVFQNLIGNAIKFQRDVRLQIHIGVEEDASEWVFRVVDNGIGIDEAYVERIFVIFQRLHTREEYPGTGIGLAICKKIVERHGGRIWLTSEVGEGTTFYFSLPKEHANHA